MILIPEQVKEIRMKVLELRENIAKYSSYFVDKKIEDFGDSKNLPMTSSLIEDQYRMEIQQLKEYEQLLRESTFIKKINTDRIEFGTKFGVRFNEGEELEYYTLTENSIGINSSDGFISVQSILGQSLYGKKDGENFSYEINIGGNKRVVEGEIVSIIKDCSLYIDYLRNKRMDCRKGTLERKNRAQNNSLDDISKRNAITQSQVDILQEELERLEIIIKKGNLSSQECRIKKGRLSNIRKMLTDNNIAKLPEDGTVGIGSHVSIVLFGDAGITTRRVELINHAVSYELTTDYVEKISPLGSRIFGLENNDSFLYYKNRKSISGIVYDIDNSKNAMRTTDPLVYQKSLKKNN